MICELNSSNIVFGRYSSLYDITYHNKHFTFENVFWYKDVQTDKKLLYFTTIVDNEASNILVVFWNIRHINEHNAFKMFNTQWISSLKKYCNELKEYNLSILHLSNYIKYLEQKEKNS